MEQNTNQVIGSTRDTKDLYTEDYRTLITEIKTLKMGGNLTFMDQRLEIAKTFQTTQSDLQIQYKGKKTVELMKLLNV